MASMCFFFGAVPRCNRSLDRRFDICKPKYLSQLPLMAVSTDQLAKPEQVIRRSANYQPSLWSFDYIQSLSSKYIGEDYASRANSLKEAVKTMIQNAGKPSGTLELVDDLQRLGIAYNFVDEISDAMEMIYRDYFQTEDKWNKMDINLKAIGFRLLRQHGYHVPQEIFGNFIEKIQDLKPHSHEDMKGILNLYEASYYSFENEDIMDNARDITTKYLNENLENLDENILPLVTHALEVPLNWRIRRVEAQWFIKAYENRGHANPTLIELAKLDFDMVQAIYLEDLKHASRWWKNTKWEKKFNFARDRLVESFMWTIGIIDEPRLSFGRRSLAKVIAMITTIDDVYDVYGTLDELEQFTDATRRWDLNAIKQLPEYMQTCFFGFYNSINDITYDTLTDTGLLILEYLKEAWLGICKAYLVEARWYHDGYTPTFKEYTDNGITSISGPLVLMHVMFFTSISSNEEILQCLKRSESIIRYSSIIFRLADDLGTSADEMARGDIAKSIQCYMHETGATEEEARTYIKSLMMETWKILNKERPRAGDSQFLKEFYDGATNLVKTSQFFYNDGDGHGHPDVTKSRVQSLLLNPIQGM
uniref:R-linalool synthase QH1, chloroplastic-like n=1 Tax=Erigeron canadensis TaxID=72917 RepID=UPI001CB98A6F|nr:R-linalool synthase QH1, chloroplastic-like [Erigeron canadensis]